MLNHILRRVQNCGHKIYVRHKDIKWSIHFHLPLLRYRFCCHRTRKPELPGVLFLLAGLHTHKNELYLIVDPNVSNFWATQACTIPLGHNRIEYYKKYREIASHFDDHADAAARHKAHHQMEHIQGFTQSH